MPNLDGIKEFLEVVDAGSFSRAAEKMLVSTPQVSKSISKLEKRLGVRLLHRTTRRLSLTDEGKRYLEYCKQSMSLLDEAELELGQANEHPSGVMKINLSGWFQERFLIPLLTDFIKLHPQLELVMTFTDNNVDLVTDGYDLSICGGALQDSSLSARRLASCRFCICASPAYLYEHGTPQSLADLANHNCLSGLDRKWGLSDHSHIFEYEVSGNWRSDNAHAILTATLHGAGIGYLPVFALDEMLAEGGLIEILPQYTRHSVPVWALYPSRQMLSAKVRVFIDYLINCLSVDNLDEEMQQHLLGIDIPG
ncbi:MAG: LysR family transcriptional regulator [Pseudomonadales bacterium]|nr:LysR family transcriptional regulator [Pseudomonadales bacterium]